MPARTSARSVGRSAAASRAASESPRQPSSAASTPSGTSIQEQPRPRRDGEDRAAEGRPGAGAARDDERADAEHRHRLSWGRSSVERRADAHDRGGAEARMPRRGQRAERPDSAHSSELTVKTTMPAR